MPDDRLHRDQSSTSSGPYRPTETSRLVSKLCACGVALTSKEIERGRCNLCGIDLEPKDQGLPSEVGTKGLTDQQTGQSPAITSFSAPESSMGAGETPADYIEPTEPACCDSPHCTQEAGYYCREKLVAVYLAARAHRDVEDRHYGTLTEADKVLYEAVNGVEDDR